MPEPERVAFIGLGIMGQPMARNLLEAGSRSRALAEPGTGRRAGGRGGCARRVPVGGCARSDIVITMLPDTPDVEQVLLGDDGVASGARRERS